jgi:hypothetical protein
VENLEEKAENLEENPENLKIEEKSSPKNGINLSRERQRRKCSSKIPNAIHRWYFMFSPERLFPLIK